MLMDAYDHAMSRLSACLTPRVLQTPAKLVQSVENPRLETLQDHVIRVLHLPIHAGVRHGGPINADVILVAES